MIHLRYAGDDYLLDVNNNTVEGNDEAIKKTILLLVKLFMFTNNGHYIPSTTQYIANRMKEEGIFEVVEWYENPEVLAEKETSELKIY